MMTWLDPQRCQQQVSALRATKRPSPRPTHIDEFLRALNYQNVPATYAETLTYFDEIIDAPDRQEDLRVRLAAAPNFSNQLAQADGFTEEEALRETSWVLGRALRLCAAGRGGSANCDDAAITLVREQGLRRVGLAPPSAASGFRRPTIMEDAFIVLADMLRDPDLCYGVAGDALSVGWSDKPGLQFVTSQAACRMRVASTIRDPDACQGVAAISDSSLDGGRATERDCRQAVTSGEPLFPPPPVQPNWPVALSALGYGSDLKSDDPVSWNALASRLTNPVHQDHPAFRARVRAASKAYVVTDAQTNSLGYSEADLQLISYQFAADRFHCSLDWSDVADRTGAPQQSYWTPEAPTFSLLSHKSERVSEKDFAGSYTLAYFGFTSCPDICPISLTTIRTALGELGDQRSQVKPLFFTLDPSRDTPDVLADYVGRFGEDFVALTGTAQEVDRAARSFNVYYFAGEIDGIPTVEHTSYFYLIDPAGRTVKFFEYGVNAQDMATELRAILAGQQPSPGGEVRKAITAKKPKRWWNYDPN